MKKIRINKISVSEDKYSYLYMSSGIPEFVQKNSIVVSGDFQEIIDIKEETNFMATFLADCAENDGSHIKAVVEEGKVEAPVMFKDYKTGEFVFENDPASSLQTAWECVGSPETFYIYIKKAED